MNPNFNSNMSRQAQRVADALVAEVSGTRAVVVATSDGFDIAHAAKNPVEPPRLAAILSSFAAVGEAASRETEIGVPRCLVVEASGGRILVRCIELMGQPLVVVILTDLTVLLGMVWNALARVEQQLARV